MSAITELTRIPDPQYVMSPDGMRIATYSWGEDADPTVVLVHGFASSTRDNWVNTGWVRDLLRAGRRVLAIDQRGHGASEKPHDPRDYDLALLAADVRTVLDTHLIDAADYETDEDLLKAGVRENIERLAAIADTAAAYAVSDSQSAKLDAGREAKAAA